MIPISPAAEPANFELRVRQPGNAFLQSIPQDTKIDFTRRDYWRRILSDLHSVYEGICAYSCHWIPFDTGNDTVEHFVPKAIDRWQAYEWSNYRLVCGRLNGRKGDHQDVVDPFQVVTGMFLLDFPSLCVIVGDNVTAAQMLAANSTIKRLRLNDNRCISMRQEFVQTYLDKHISYTHLQRKAPFLASELRRQNLSKRSELRTRMNQ
jgi:hypothetical protein